MVMEQSKKERHGWARIRRISDQEFDNEASSYNRQGVITLNIEVIL